MTEWRLEFRGTLFPFRGGELTLGRSSYSSIVINNPLTSREHAVVRSAAGGKIEIVDLGSKNGTLVNDERITAPYRLEIGDRIKIGSDVIDVVKASPEDPLRLRAITLPGKPSGRPESTETVEEETTEITKRGE